MKLRNWLRCLGCGVMLCGWEGPRAVAQDDASSLEADGEPSTLPPITVTPPDEETSVVDETPASTAPAARSPYDLPYSYPSLSGQLFEDLSGVTRRPTNVFDDPSEVTIINRQQLDERMPQDMFQALEREVGVLMQRTARGQASPFLRGLTGQQLLILVDGIRLNNSTFRTGANQYSNTIDPGQVERIEVMRGPQSTLYGSDALGGAINIVTRSASPFDGNYRGGSFTEYFSTADTGSYSRGNVEGWVQNSGVFAGASYLNLNDLDRGGDLGRQPFTGYDQYAGDVKYNYLLSEDALVTVALQHFEQDDLPRSDRFPPFVFGPPVGAPRPTFFDPQQRDLAYLRLQGVAYSGWCDSYMLTASYARQKEGSREIRSATRTDIGEFEVDTLGVSMVMTKDLDWLGALSYGTDFYHDDVDAFKNRLNPVNGAITPDIAQFPDDSYYDRFGVFTNWNVELTDRLTANTGVRYENIGVSSTPLISIDPPGAPPAVLVPTHISPSYQDWVGNVGLTYALTERWNLVGSISEGFRAPNLDDLVATNTLVQQNGQDIPSISLDPEHSINYEVGMKWDYRKWHSQAFVFWTELEDNILRTPVATGLFQRDNRDSYLNGVEWYGEYLLTPRWSVYGNFAYTYGKDLELDIPLSRIPPMQGIAGLRWRDQQHRSWFDVYTWLVDEQDRLNFQDLTDARIPVGGTPGYQTFNIRAGRTLGRCDNHRVSLTLENIFDQAYRVHGSGVDGPGFNAICGYELHW
ncbi:MAG: TonB-dependent receptor [Planctomycetia bacterium]|nr:TonB-dependent receptor [Planctomycetia bacterium]